MYTNNYRDAIMECEHHVYCGQGGGQGLGVRPYPATMRDTNPYRVEADAQPLAPALAR